MKILVLLLLLLSSCAPVAHLAQAPRRARHTYHQAERHHARERRQAAPAFIPWN